MFWWYLRSSDGTQLHRCNSKSKRYLKTCISSKVSIMRFFCRHANSVCRAILRPFSCHNFPVCCYIQADFFIFTPRCKRYLYWMSEIGTALILSLDMPLPFLRGNGPGFLFAMLISLRGISCKHKTMCVRYLSCLFKVTINHWMSSLTLTRTSMV